MNVESNNIFLWPDKLIRTGEHIYNEPLPIDSSIRFFRIPFVPDEPLPHLLNDEDYTQQIKQLIGDDLFMHLPSSAFHKPDIAVLHGELMRAAAMKKDGVVHKRIAKETLVTRYDIEKFCRLEINNPRDENFYTFMRWIIKHKYTLNQIIYRKDAFSLIEQKKIEPKDEPSVERKISLEWKQKQYERIIRSNLLGNGFRSMGQLLGLKEGVCERVYNRKWDELSDDAWRKIKKSLDDYFNGNA